MKIDGRHISGGVLMFLAVILIGLVVSVTILLAESGYLEYPKFEQPEPPKKKGKK